MFVPNLIMRLDLSYEILTKSSSRTDKVNQNLTRSRNCPPNTKCDIIQTEKLFKKNWKIADLDDFWEPHIVVGVNIKVFIIGWRP